MKKHLIGFITGIFIASLIIFMFQIFIMKSWERDDVSLLLQLITGIAPFVAAFGAYYMWSKNRDYKNDHYKKLVDKRLEAYQKLCEFIGEFDIEKRLLIVGKDTKLADGKPYLRCFDNNKLLNEAIEKYLNLTKYKYWFSNEIEVHLDKINKILVEKQTYLNAPGGPAIRSKYQKEDGKPVDSIISGCNCFKNIRQELQLIYTAIANDYKNIGKVQLFFDNKN